MFSHSPLLAVYVLYMFSHSPLLTVCVLALTTLDCFVFSHSPLLTVLFSHSPLFFFVAEMVSSEDSEIDEHFRRSLGTTYHHIFNGKPQHGEPSPPPSSPRLPSPPTEERADADGQLVEKINVLFLLDEPHQS